ncbi:MAG: hypothetical protein QF371_03075, partial [Flavobacteriales bacterium]|nr:hypothetical protein [Flavobacteriales bacterium]
MKKTLTLLFITIAVGLLAHFYTWNWELKHDSNLISAIQEDFLHLDDRIKLLLEEIENEQVGVQDLDVLWQQEGIGFVIYNNGSATTWTTNSIPFPSTFQNRTRPREGLVQLKNAWYLCRLVEDGNQLLVAYALIATDYNFENRYVENSWGPNLRGPKNYHLTLSDLDTHALRYKDGKEAAYIRVSDKTSNGLMSWSAGLWLLFIGLVILTLWYAVDWMEESIPKAWSSWLFVGLLAVFRSLMLWWDLPRSIYALELFGPSLHASSSVIPSLGDFLLHLCFLLVAIFRIHHLGGSNSSKIRHWLGVCVPVLLLWPVHYLFEILVVNSS